MTNRQFWAKLAGFSKTKKDDVLGLCKLIRQGYKEDLTMICGVRHTAPDIVHQLYINIDESDPTIPGNRFMLCFTSMSMARSDKMLTEPVETLPVRFVVDNALNKAVIGGLVFNHHDEDRIMICPKEFLSETTLMKAMEAVFGSTDGQGK